MSVAAKGPMGRADWYASQIVRARVGHCEKCGTTRGLTCSHIIKRTFSGTRCDLENLQSICWSCHARIEQFPDERMAWFAESIGLDKYEELKAKALAGVGKKYDWPAIRDELKAIWKQMEQAA